MNICTSKTFNILVITVKKNNSVCFGDILYKIIKIIVKQNYTSFFLNALKVYFYFASLLCKDSFCVFWFLCSLNDKNLRKNIKLKMQRESLKIKILLFYSNIFLKLAKFARRALKSPFLTLIFFRK